MTTPRNKRGCPSCGGIDPKSCLRCRGKTRLSDWTDELPPPVKDSAMSTPTPRTDAKAWGFRRQTVGAVESAIEWAEELERDLAAAKEALAQERERAERAEERAALLLRLIETVMAIPTMTDEQLAELQRNCRAAIAGEKK